MMMLLLLFTFYLSFLHIANELDKHFLTATHAMRSEWFAQKAADFYYYY